MLAHNVAALLKSPPGTTRPLAIDEPEPRLGPGPAACAPVRGTCLLTRTPWGILAQCELRSTFEQECGRCLSPFRVEVTTRFDEEFRPSVNVATGLAEQPVEDVAARIDERHVLDLTEMARQYFLLALPLQPICRPECRGLCGQCGANRNEQACGCASDAKAGPFGGLASLLRPDNG